MAAGDREAKRLRVLKQRGSRVFTEGNVSEASEMYFDAMQIEMEQDLKKGSPRKSWISLTDCDREISGELSSSSQRENGGKGIQSVVRAVLTNAEQTIKVNPNLPKAYLSKASALILQNKWEEAREVYLEGINNCDDCLALRSALGKLDKTQHLLETIPSLLERTKSTSSTDTSDSTLEGKSPQSKKRKFRLQHRKKLSRPMIQFMVDSTGRLKLTADDDDDDIDDGEDTWF